MRERWMTRRSRSQRMGTRIFWVRNIWLCLYQNKRCVFIVDVAPLFWRVAPLYFDESYTTCARIEVWNLFQLLIFLWIDKKDKFILFFLHFWNEPKILCDNICYKKYELSCQTKIILISRSMCHLLPQKYWKKAWS